MNQGKWSEQYVAWILCNSRFLKTNTNRWQKRWLSFVAVATAACRTKWASNNQLKSVAVGTVAGRYQSCFLICLVDSWDCGATDTVPAHRSDNQWHTQFGKESIPCPCWRGSSHSNPSPQPVSLGETFICWSGFRHHFSIYCTEIVGKGRQSQWMLNPSGLPGGPLFSSPVLNNFTLFSIYFRVLFKTIY